VRLRQVIALCLLALVVSGCWSRIELTDVALAGLIGIDWADGQYLVTVNILTRRTTGGESGQGKSTPDWSISTSAHSLDEAIAQLDRISARALSLAHVRTIVYGEEMSRRGIGPTLDYMLRAVELRPTVWLSVTPGTAKELLQARPVLQQSPSDGPLGYQDTARLRASVSPAVRLVEAARILQEEGIDLNLPVYRLGNQAHPAPEGALEPDPQQAKEVVYGGSAVFHHDRLVAWLSPIAARGVLWSTGQGGHSAVTVPCGGKNQEAVFRIRSSKGRASVRLVRGKPAGEIIVRVNADLNDLTCSGVVSEGDSTQLEGLLRQEVEREIREALRTVRKSGADIFGFGQQVFRQSPAQYRRLETAWSEELADMPVQVDVTTRVTRLGQLNRHYLWDERRE